MSEVPLCSTHLWWLVDFARLDSALHHPGVCDFRQFPFCPSARFEQLLE